MKGSNPSSLGNPYPAASTMPLDDGVLFSMYKAHQGQELVNYPNYYFPVTILLWYKGLITLGNCQKSPFHFTG